MVTFMLYFHSRPRNSAIRGLDYACPSWRSLAPDYLCPNTMFVLYLSMPTRASRQMWNTARSFLEATTVLSQLLYKVEQPHWHSFTSS